MTTSTTFEHPDPFALARPDEGDAALVALFHRWREAHIRMDGNDWDDDDELQAVLDAVHELARAVYDTPAIGAVGFVVKAFMVGFDLYGRRRPIDVDCELSSKALDGYDCFGNLRLDAHSMRGLLADAARFIPELAPLVAEIINLPLTKPIAEAAQ